MRLMFIILISFLLNYCLFAQSRAQLGLFAGPGTLNFEGNSYNKKISWDFGASAIVSFKKYEKVRTEYFLRYLYNYACYNSQSATNTDNYTYVNSRHTWRMLDVGVKWQFPIFYRDNYRLLVGPGFMLGELLVDYAVIDTYSTATGELISHYQSDNQVVSRFLVGVIGSVMQEFNVSKSVYLHLDVAFNSQIIFEIGGSGPWKSFLFRPGIYWKF